MKGKRGKEIKIGLIAEGFCCCCKIKKQDAPHLAKPILLTRKNIQGACASTLTVSKYQ